VGLVVGGGEDCVSVGWGGGGGGGGGGATAPLSALNPPIYAFSGGACAVSVRACVRVCVCVCVVEFVVVLVHVYRAR